MRSTVSPVLSIGVIAILGLLLVLAAPATFQPAGGTGVLTVVGITPIDGARLPSRAVTIGAEVTGERELQRVTLLVNGAEVTPTREPRDARRWRISYTLQDEALEAALRAAPEQQVHLVARDLYGRQISRTWRFQLDSAMSAPVVADLQPPANGYAPAGGARLGATAQSDAPITAAALSIDGRAQPVTIQPSGSDKVTISARVDLKVGKYEATLTVTDREGDRAVRRWDFRVPDPGELLAFEQTGKAIGGGFRRFWQEKGGLEIFGPPISDELREGGLTVQYFERARFEYHPSKDGLLSEVHLGLLGRDLSKPDPPRPDPGNDQARFFPETGLTISGPIRRYFEEKGGIGIFGLPITAEARESGMTIQYFERARFEVRAASDTVTLGAIGREVYERRLKGT